MKKSVTQYAALGVCLLCVIADPLGRISPVLKWIDELICLGACLCGAMLWLPKVELRRQMPKHLLYFIPFFLYMFMQLMGSLIFRFQPWSAAVIDALTNAKFWMTLYGCYLIGRVLPDREADRGFLCGAKFSLIAIFIMFLLDRFGLVFPRGHVDNPWGIPWAQLIYSHPTYLSAAMVFILAVFLANWNKDLWLFAIWGSVVMAFTFRSKAYGAVVAFWGVLGFVVIWKQRVRLWHVAATGIALVAVAWKKIEFYFITLGDVSARAVMLKTSIIVMRDYFPLGTGFGTFASHQAAIHYSPLYHKYGFTEGTTLHGNRELSFETRRFLDDHFWPIVFAQSGFIGTCAFVGMLALLISRVWKLWSYSRMRYAAGLMCLAYLLISSTSEPAFNNQVAIPIACLLGYMFGQADGEKYKM